MLENSYSAISTSLLCYYAFLLSGSSIQKTEGESNQAISIRYNLTVSVPSS